ncbi:MAG: hypothetical protein IKY16_06875 [Bacteroidales bacterium]|nr:hypothetical protein [Bacteroidales bacterium]
MHIKISSGNSKMGSIRSVSLPAGLTCVTGCECNSKCYGRKLERMRPSVRNAYQNNLEVLRTDPKTYWREVEATVMLSRFFRFHVSGDIPDDTYFEHMVDIARTNPHCEILCFTKKYDIVNSHVSIIGKLPMNLHIIFSVWRNFEMDNPFLFPEAHVRYRDGTTTAPENAIECAGNCTECAVTEEGCWTLQKGESVIFNEH